MMGSAIDGEDVVQDTLLKTLRASDEGAGIENLEGWAFRVAHNGCLDLLRRRSRNTVVPLTEDLEAEPLPDGDIVAVSFATFLRLPELQRCAVILKDVLGHSVEEVASVAGCSLAAAKSALQRGRLSLKQLAQTPADIRLPLISDTARRKMAVFTDLFRAGDFDAIRAILAEDVQLELVNRLHWRGRDRIVPYFTRYAQEPRWSFSFGAVEGRPVMLVFDHDAPDTPAHFVLVAWRGDRIAKIRDFLFAPYVLEAADWARLDATA